MERELLTVKETAEILGYSVPRMYQLIKAGIVPACKLPGPNPGKKAIRIPRKALQEWLNAQTEAALASVRSGT
jgi:excisionase family DNA binding protein